MNTHIDKLLSKCLIVLIMFFLTSICFSLDPKGELKGPFQVLKIIDGDTIELADLGTAKLLGLDAPERYDGEALNQSMARSGLSQAFIKAQGEEAASFLTKLLSRGSAWVEFDSVQRDDFNRVLAYIYIEDSRGAWKVNNKSYTQINYQLVRSGFAQPQSTQPNVAYDELFLQAATLASVEGRGFWPQATVQSADDKTVAIKCIGFAFGQNKETLTLRSTKDTDLSGWRVVDKQGNAWYLNGNITAYTDFVTQNPGNQMWNSGGDEARLFNTYNQLVDQFSYTSSRGQACRPE